MRERIQISADEKIIFLAETVVFEQKSYWSNVDYRQLCLSILRPREQYQYDEKGVYPLIVFLCGGAFQKMDRNVWIPELVEYAKKGYVIASVDYSVLPYTIYPEALEDVKAAIRYLRANAGRFSIDPERIAVMGESAGGCLSALAAVTSEMREFDKGENCEFSSAVKSAVLFYPATDPLSVSGKSTVDISGYPDIRTLLTEKCPPIYILHGIKDEEVPYSQSVQLYEKMREMGLVCDLTLIEDAHHADAKFYQDAVKERVIGFLDKYLK